MPTGTICPVKDDLRNCSTCAHAKGCRDFEDYPARYKRLYRKYLGRGYKSLREDQAIDLINAMQQVIHDLKRKSAEDLEWAAVDRRVEAKRIRRNTW